MKPPAAPRLDDRSFEQLRREAVERIRAACPAWTDFSPSDPGIALVEAFAFLTEVMLYRLNRVPERQYAAFLALLGARQHPPAAATALLRFSRSNEATGPLTVPAGTRVSGGGVTFTTMAPVTIPAGEREADGTAFHGTPIDGERLGTGSGLPGLELAVAHPPIVAPMLDRLDLVLGVEDGDAPRGPATRAIEHDGRTFHVWREVETFANTGPADEVFTVDRLRGVIRFAPATRVLDDDGVLTHHDVPLGAVPRPGREIRVWYRTGGGVAGNVAAGTLGRIEGGAAVVVTNPFPAAGGREAEPVANLAVRAVADFHRLDRAVTARDYESIALDAAAVARARAFTKAEHWRHARPGVVEVLLVPEGEPNESERAKVVAALDRARPAGTRCEVRWTRYKGVTVRLRAVVARQEDGTAVQRRILDRLHRLISPLPAPGHDGWAFGRTLRRYEVEGAVRSEPGVLYVSSTELLPELLPEGVVTTVAVDQFQPRTWYAGSGSTLFRSLNGGDGWELVQQFPGERIQVVRSSPIHPGLQAVITRVEGDEGGSRIHLSEDCGETWRRVHGFVEQVEDAAWLARDRHPALMVASNRGLHEIVFGETITVLAVEVDAAAPSRGFYAVAAHTDVRGVGFVAAAAYERDGVWLSRAGGAGGTWELVGLQGKDVRALAVQWSGVRSFLWAAITVSGMQDVAGAQRYELGPEKAAEGWREFIGGWRGGSCRAIACTPEGVVLGGSNSRGVLRLDTARAEPAWEVPPVDAGLPLRDEHADDPTPGRILHPIHALAVDASAAPAGAPPMIVAGTVRGVSRTRDPMQRWEAVTDPERMPPALRERVTLPPTWLFASGTHEVDVLSEDEARGPDADG